MVVVKRRHRFLECRCAECGKKFRAPIPVRLKEENQYGSRVQALCLSLMDIGNVSVNKVQKMICGLSEGDICPSEGYIIKLQKRAAFHLRDFIYQLKKRCRSLGQLYWDDTVIYINGNRGCLRFYGDETLALYTAHRQKNKEGLDEDRILKLLPPGTVVMHDHNKVNYNAEYSYQNIECNAHLMRDLQKTTDHLGHSWSGKLKKLLSDTNAERNRAMERGETEFPEEYTGEFFRKFDEIMAEGIEENKKDYNKYYGSDERTLLVRILEYKDNYLSWVVNFDLPFTNNLSERALRDSKSKMKIAGQFQNEKTAQDYAAVKSYIETCYRNGINGYDALVRLCEGKPYTVNEIFQTEEK